MSLNLIYSKLNNKGIYYNPITYNDFNVVNNSLVVASTFNNPIEYDIQNDYGYKYIFNKNGTNPFVKYQSPASIPDSMNLPYTTQHKWNSFRSLNFIDNLSGDYISVYGITPTYLTLSSNFYTYFDFESIDYKKFGSILLFNQNTYDLSTGIKTNLKTNDIEVYNSSIYYGGLIQDNHLNINCYSIDEFIKYEIDFAKKKNRQISSVEYQVCISGYIDPFTWTTIFGYDYYSPYWYHYRTKQGHNDKSFYLVDSILEGNNGAGSKYSNKAFKQNYTIRKDSLVFLQGSLDNPQGSIDLDYVFYHQIKSGFFDFMPDGYVHPPSAYMEPLRLVGLGYSYTLYGYWIDASGGYHQGSVLRPAKIDIEPQIKTVELSNPASVFSSGTFRFYGSSTVAQIEAEVSAASPYGVTCTGNNIFDMMIYVKGDLSAGDLSNAIDFNDFSYKYSYVDLTSKNNRISNSLKTHGKVDSSGNIIWSDSHGCESIRYHEYRGTGIENNLYHAPNHFGEVYKVMYNQKKNQVTYTGNLVNDFVSRPVESRGIMDSGVFIPTGQLISNVLPSSGIVKSSFNLKSLEYLQSKTSDITCGEKMYIPQNLIKYTGEYPDFMVYPLTNSSTIIVSGLI